MRQRGWWFSRQNGSARVRLVRAAPGARVRPNCPFALDLAGEKAQPIESIHGDNPIEAEAGSIVRVEGDAGGAILTGPSSRFPCL